MTTKVQSMPLVMPNAEYQAKDAVSATDIKNWINTCPKVWHQLKYGDANIEPPTALKKAFRDGELAHAFTLEPLMASAHYVVCPSKATKAGKEKAAEIAASGQEAITQAEYDLSSNIADAVHNHPLASKLLSFGTPELSFFTQDKKSGIEVKARPDWLVGDLIIDLKTTGEGGASPEKAIKTIANLNYHIQAAHYLETVQAKEFNFIFVEKVYPFAVGIYKLDKDALLEGRSLREQALKEISLCHTDNYWRGYSETVQTLSMPRWAFKN